MTSEWKKWLAVGTGVGIEIGGGGYLTVTVARVRPSGVKVLGSLTIPHYREQPAAEWGAVYGNFLRKLGHGHLAATVLLPRQEVVVRQVQLAGVADRDLEAALRFQIDSLHPFGDDEAAYSWARVRKTTTLLVGIARRRVIEEHAALFAEAGIKVHAFTFSAASVYSAMRVLTAPPVDGFLAFEEENGEVETYGESPARPVFSARLELPVERATALALAELRLPQDTPAAALHEILPKPSAAPVDYDLPRTTFTYATAVASACPWLALDINLLPAAQREASSRLLYVPTIVLGVLALVTGGALLAYSGYEDSRYLTKLRAEIQKIQPRAEKAAALDRQIAITRNRAQALDNFRHRLKDDMNALNDLSNIVASPAWLTSMQLTRDSVSIAGETERAEALLKMLDGSKQFRRSEFTLPISRGMAGENFSIHSVREGVAP